jgi:hypothetical protein
MDIRHRIQRPMTNSKRRYIQYFYYENSHLPILNISINTTLKTDCFGGVINLRFVDMVLFSWNVVTVGEPLKWPRTFTDGGTCDGIDGHSI